MANHNPWVAWQQAMITYEFRLYQTCISSVEEHFRSAQQDFRTKVDEEASKILNPDELDDFYHYHSDEDQDFESLTRISTHSIFVASISLFEVWFSRICRFTQQRAKNPISLKDFGNFSLDRARRYLERLEVRVPTGTDEWRNASTYYKIRNAIVHSGSAIEPKADIAGFCRRQGIINTPHRDPQSGAEDKDFPLELVLTKEFCEEAMDCLKNLLFMIVSACNDRSAGDPG